MFVHLAKEKVRNKKLKHTKSKYHLASSLCKQEITASGVDNGMAIRVAGAGHFEKGYSPGDLFVQPQVFDVLPFPI